MTRRAEIHGGVCLVALFTMAMLDLIVGVKDHSVCWMLAGAVLGSAAHAFYGRPERDV